MIELKNKISTDLKIDKFKNEFDLDYNQRLIYSALSSWIRGLLHGNSMNDFNNNVDEAFPDIMYIQHYLSKIAEAMLKVMPCNRDWCDNEDIPAVAMNIAGQVIQDMIMLYEIGEVMGRKLSPVPYRESYFSKFTHIYGTDYKGKEIFVVGCSIWKVNNDLEKKASFDSIVNIEACDYYKYIKEEFPWKEQDINGNFEIFQVGSVRRYAKCWMSFEKKYVEKDGIYLLRDTNTYESGYFLLKKSINKTYIVILDPWYVENKEIYRIMYALNLNNGTPANFRIRDFDDYKVLYYPTALPLDEDRIIRSISWPYSTYKDAYAKVIPQQMWGIAEEVISRLGGIIVG